MSIAILRPVFEPPQLFQRCFDPVIRAELSGCNARYRRFTEVFLVDVLDIDATLCCPCHQPPTDILWAIVDPDNLRFPTPLDNLVQVAHDPFSGQRKVHLDA